MATVNNVQGLQEHLQCWDPPDDVLDEVRKFASYEQAASFEKWEGQQVYRCIDGGLDAAVAPVLQKLQFRPV